METLSHPEDFIAKLHDMELHSGDNPVLFIGVCGGSASGKTTLCRLIEKYYDGQAGFLIISTDSFYKDLTPKELDMARQGQYDFDCPDAIDFDLLLKCLQNFQKGESFSVPNYSYTECKRLLPPPIPTTPSKIVLIEGIHVFCDEKIRSMLSLSIFLEVPMDIMLARRIRRDTVERGRTVDGIISQYMRFVRGGYINYIEPTKKFADVILKSDQTLIKGLMLVLSKTDNFLAAKVPFDEEKVEKLGDLMGKLGMTYTKDGNVVLY